MQRELTKLHEGSHDLIIIGGGIHGLSAAWDAALRGLSVALIEQSDFGAATTSNSFRIVHGGLRYLQHLNLKRMRMSIGERSHLMRMAPHLIQPLPFLVPCYGHGMKGPEALRAALAINDMVGADRNATLDPAVQIPPGYMLSRDACLEQFPGLCNDGLSGGAVFYDGQMYDSERLTLAFAHSASQAGASLANYVQATGIRRLQDGSMVVAAKDQVTGNRFDICGRMVLNTAGPWVARVLSGLAGAPAAPEPPVYSKGVQILTRSFMPEMAVALEGQQSDTTARLSRGKRSWFVTPWRGHAFIGTTDTRFEGQPETFRITRADIDELLDAINAAYPPAQLTQADVVFWNGGLRPCEAKSKGGNAATASHETRIIDHAKENLLDGIISISGVKYTTCRYVAERTIDLIAGRLCHKPTSQLTRDHTLAGGDMPSWKRFVEAQLAGPILNETHTLHMAHLYGSDMSLIRKRIQDDPTLAEGVSAGASLTRAEVVHAIKHECALTLEDVIMRRTGVGATGNPGAPLIEAVANEMAPLLDWSDTHTRDQIDSASARFTLADDATR
ncbi:MAG: glycerol-3-phosphate dehydrogenase/oxidase [Kiritimatiellae bacterium]|nr:glycerol-3-phosphate dehydrogenase/oxidase [Kiritimatiellia bacterium]